MTEDDEGGGETPRKTIRVPDELWDEYGDAVRHYGRSRTADLVMHMRAKVHDHRKRQEEGAGS